MDMDRDRIQVHSFDDVAGHAHMLDQFPPSIIAPDSSLGGWFQTILTPYPHEAPFPVNVSITTRRFGYCDLLNDSLGRKTYEITVV